MKNEWHGGALLSDIIDDVRIQISDDAELYTDTFIISAINSALKLIALEEDARRIFRYKLQTELATINKDGTPAARWAPTGARSSTAQVLVRQPQSQPRPDHA